MITNSSDAVFGWIPVSQLRQIETDIAKFGYSRDFIEKNSLLEKRSPYSSNMITGQIEFFEFLEVIEKDGKVFYRENDKHHHIDIPDVFETQFGVFLNHNNGEFASWVGKEDGGSKVLPAGKKRVCSFFEREAFYIEGNFCDLFDCGDYVYGISNQMHMGLGWFQIVRIDKKLDYEILFDNQSSQDGECFEYAGRVANEKGYILIVSGFCEKNSDQKREQCFLDKTLLIQIDESGGCQVVREWPFKISSPNSLAALDGYVYFGQNKMVTKLDLKSGEKVYLTNKNDAELAALQKMW